MRCSLSTPPTWTFIHIIGECVSLLPRPLSFTDRRVETAFTLSCFATANWHTQPRQLPPALQVHTIYNNIIILKHWYSTWWSTARQQGIQWRNQPQLGGGQSTYDLPAWELDNWPQQWGWQMRGNTGSERCVQPTLVPDAVAESVEHWYHLREIVDWNCNWVKPMTYTIYTCHFLVRCSALSTRWIITESHHW